MAVYEVKNGKRVEIPAAERAKGRPPTHEVEPEQPADDERAEDEE